MFIFTYFNTHSFIFLYSHLGYLNKKDALFSTPLILCAMVIFLPYIPCFSFVSLPVYHYFFLCPLIVHTWYSFLGICLFGINCFFSYHYSVLYLNGLVF